MSSRPRAIPPPALPLAFLLALAALSGACFPRGPGPRLAHFETTAPAVGAPAPHFELRGLDGETVPLASLLGEKPVVLQLGSHSCPVYRYRRHWMRDLVEDFGERVHFVVVYTLEAHPVGSKSPYVDGEWDPWINRLTGVRVQQPESWQERASQAQESRERLRPGQTMLVDGMDDAVWRAYGAASSPAFVIDREGRIVVRQVWIDPDEIRRVLEDLLAEEQ